MCPASESIPVNFHKFVSGLFLLFLGVPDHGVSGWWRTLHAAAEGEDAHGGHRNLLPLSGQPMH
jgi:hypothetical protein